MGKKKDKSSYNDFLDGEKLRDNTEIRQTLPSTSTSTSIPPTQPQSSQNDPKDRRQNQQQPTPKRSQPTHFLCLPLINPNSRPQLTETLTDLTRQIEPGSNSPFESLIPLKAIRPIGTLHLTLGVMVLATEEEVARAIECLRSTDLASLLSASTPSTSTSSSVDNKEQQQQQQPLSINLTDLTPMQTPQNTSILYATPHDPTSRLYPFCTSLQSHFTQNAILVPDDRKLKLHATIVNTIYAKPRGKAGGRGRGKGHGPDAKSWMRFDARGLMEAYEGFVWAKGVAVDRVQICKMGAREVVLGDGEGVDERYEVVFEKAIL